MAPELFHSIEAEELRDIAQRVQSHQEASKLSDVALLRKYAELGSTKTYRRILANDLAELDLEKQLTNYRAVWALIEGLGAQRGAQREDIYEDFIGVAQFRRALLAVIEETSPARFVILEGDTGTGKTSARRYVQEKYGTAILSVEAHAAWGDAPMAMLGAILRVLGIKELPVSQAERMDKTVEILNASRRCIAIDEAHHMGVRCLNILKSLINLTPGAFVALAYPTLWARLERTAYHECRQLTGNRLAERIRLTVLKPDVKKFVSRRLPLAEEALNGKFDQVIAMLTEKSPRYGNYAFVREVCNRVQTLSEGTDGPSYEQFTGAMNAEAESR